MLNNFNKDSNNIFDREQRLVYFNGFEASFAGRINEQENFENEEVSSELQDALDNLSQFSDNEVEPGSNLFHTLVELFGENRNIAAEVTDALDDSAEFGSAFNELDAMYSPDQAFDSVSYESATQTISFIKDGEPVFEADLNTLRSRMYMEAVQAQEAREEVFGDSIAERQALRATLAELTPDQRQGMIESYRTAAEANESIEVSVNGNQFSVPAEIVLAELETIEGQATLVESSEINQYRELLGRRLRFAHENQSHYTSFHMPVRYQGQQINRQEVREMIATGRLENSDLIAEYLRTLNTGLDDMLDIVLRRRNGQNIDAGRFIANTEFAATNRRGEKVYRNDLFQNFIGETGQMYSNIDALTPEQQQELARRAEVFEALDHLVYELSHLSEGDETILNPDYVTDVEFSDDLRNQLDLRGGEFRGGKDEFGVLAVYTYLFGPLESIVNEMPGVRATTDGDGRQTVIVESLSPDHLQTLQRVLESFPEIERLNIGVRGRRSLTRALEKLRSDEDFAAFRAENYRFSLDRSVGNRNDNQVALTHLRAIFDINDTGPTFRQHRHSLSTWEIEFENGEGSNEDFLDRRNSQFSRYRWILDDPSIFTYENGQRQINLDTLAQRLSTLAEQGKTILFMNRDLAEEQREQYREVNTYFTSADLRSNTPMPEELRYLIQYGALNEGMLEQALNEAQEIAPQQTPLYEDFHRQLVENGVDQSEIPRLIRSAEQFMIGALRNENGELDGLEAGVSRTFAMGRDGRFRIGPSAGVSTDGDVVLGINLSGDLIDAERGRLYAESFVGTRNEILNPIDGGIPGYRIAIGGQADLGQRGWFIAAEIGAVGALIPYGNLEIGRSTDALVRREFERDGDMGDVSPDTFLAIRNGQEVTDELATQILAELGPDHPINDAINQAPIEMRAGVAREFVRMFALEKSNDALRDADGATLAAGLTVYGVPPVAYVPYIRIGWLGRERSFYSVQDNVSNAQDRISHRLMMQQIAQQNETSSRTGSYTIVSESGDYISYDGETGVRETSFGTHAILGNINTSNGAETLNSAQEVHGLNFDRVETTAGPAYEFSIIDIADREFDSGLGTNFELLVDPSSGAMVEAIGQNRFRLRFLTNTQGYAPRNFAITRSEIIQPFGSDTIREVSLTFSNRATTPQMLRGNPHASRIRVDESGITRSTQNVLAYSRTESYSEMQGTAGFDSQDWELGYPDPVGFNSYIERTSPQELTAAVDATRELKGIVGSDRLEESYQPHRAVQLLVTKIQNDEAFMQNLAEQTTLTLSDGSPASYRAVVESINSQLPDLPDFAEFAEYTLSDADIQYILGRTIPGTFLDLTNSRFEGRRSEEVERVIEVIFRSHLEQILDNPLYNQHYVNGALVEYTQAEKETIIDYLTGTALDNADSIANNIEAMTGVPFSPTLDGYELFTTAALNRMGEESYGLREFLIGPHTGMEYVEGSRTEYQAQGELIIVDFIYGLYNPVMPTSIEGLSAEQTFDILNSEIAMNLLGMTIGEVNGDAISLLNELYGPEGVRVISRIYSQMREGSFNLTLEQLDGFERNVLRHFLTTVVYLRANAIQNQFTGNVPSITTLDGSNSIYVNLEIETGSVLILPCGNITLYAGQRMTTETPRHIRSRLSSTFARTTVLGDQITQRPERGLTISVPFVARPDRPPEEPEPEPEPEIPEEEPRKVPTNEGTSSHTQDTTGTESAQGFDDALNDRLN